MNHPLQSGRTAPCLLLALAMLPASLGAQDSTSVNRAANIAAAAPEDAQNSPEFLTAVPESPAFTFLGITPAKVTRPSTIRDFGVAIINGLDSEGKVRQGLAIEVSPWTLIPGLKVPLDRYQGDFLTRMFTNTLLSIGTTKTAGDSTSMDLAYGLRLTLIDGSDPMRDPVFTGGMFEVLEACLPETPQLPPPPNVTDPAEVEAFNRARAELAVQEVQPCLDGGMKRVYKRFSDSTAARWNAAQLSLALAGGLRFAESDLSKGASSGFRTWLVGALPLQRWGQIVGQFTYSHQPERGETEKANIFNYGGRLIFGPPRVNGFVEVIGEARSDQTEDADDTSGIWSAGIEFRISRDLWLSTGFGNRFSTFDEAETTFLIADIRWGVSQKSRLDGLRTGTEQRIREAAAGGP
ncbi:MAG: hypothetical protein OEU54_09580 [Gemmatimonadota bacterium]|nr:hypothetical protein [Gemmatimonadota bacterium]